MHPSEVWEGTGLKARVLRALLLPFSGLYALGWETYLAVYRFGFKKASAPHSPVICVGNLQVGGSGKSPFVLHLADVLRGMGKAVVISASGYGAPSSEGATLAPEGPLDPAEWGDEPAMIRWLLPDVPLVVGRARVRAAEIVNEHFPDSVMLMDDGFQHLPLAKTLTVILDPKSPKNRLCLPAGPYREPRWNRARANLVLPGEFEVVHDALQAMSPEGKMTGWPNEAVAMCALGQPDRFFQALRDTGVILRETIALPDHDPLTGGTLLAGLPEDVPTIVTAKDWVKLKGRADVGSREFLIARQRVRVEPQEAFRAWLRDRLNER